jgi:hypothetical protein
MSFAFVEPFVFGAGIKPGTHHINVSCAPSAFKHPRTFPESACDGRENLMTNRTLAFFATLKTVNPMGQITIWPKASHSPFEHVRSTFKPSTAALHSGAFFVNLIFTMEPVFSISKKRPVDGVATAGQALVMSA